MRPLVPPSVVMPQAVLLSMMILFELDGEPIFRLAAVVAIVDAALTLVIPLLHRISRTETPAADLMTPLEERNIAAIDEEISQLKRRLTHLEKLRASISEGPAQEA